MNEAHNTIFFFNQNHQIPWLHILDDKRLTIKHLES